MLPVDLTNLQYLDSYATEAVSIYGRIDILINNAGLSYRGLIVSTSTDVDYKVMLVNYLGQVALTKGGGFYLFGRQIVSIFLIKITFVRSTSAKHDGTIKWSYCIR